MECMREARATGETAGTGSLDRSRMIDLIRGVAALSVAYFHCRQTAWVGLRQS